MKLSKLKKYYFKERNWECRLLKSLMVMTILSTPLTVIVSCGNKNQDPENTLKTTFTNNPLHWLTAKTMQQSDFKILSNTNSAPLGTDEYGREYGDLFEVTNPNYSQNDPYIGIHENDYKTWTYKLRKNATWSDYQGNLLRSIEVNDFINAAKYVLNPENGSDAYFLWESFIVGAHELRLKALNPGDKSFDSIFNENIESLGIKVNESKNTVQFNLTKSASYFETLLTYTVFAPIHDNAVSDPAVDSDFKMGYYSGAFLPKSFSIDSTIVLDKNPNYHFASETKINRIREIHTSGTVSQTRDLFEANTINNYLINTNDQSGWDKYVGNASEPIKTDGLVRYDEDAEDAYTQMLFFNFLNSSYFGDTNAKKEAIIKSKLFQFSGTREFFFANLDSSIWGEYYSKIFDGDRSVSSNVRNTFVPDFIKSESKDFQTIEAEQINSEKLYGNAGTNVKKEDIKDGENFYSARAYGSEITNNSSKLKTAQSESAKKLREDLSSADNDLKEALKDGKKITLKTYLDPSKTTDERAALLEMFKTFSAIENNPITIDVITSQTSNEYQQMLDDGVEDLAISGWSPDYADAMSYSNTLKINGDHGMHFRFGQLYQFDDSKTPLNQFDSESADDTFTRLKNAHKDMYNELLIQNGEGENLFKSRYNYSKDLVNVDEKESGLKRNEDFAKLEAQTLYKDYFAMPLIRRSPSMTFTITNLVPFTSSRVPYGLSALQFGNYDFSSNLLSYDKIEDLRIAYLSKKDEVDKDKTKYRDSLAWQ